MNKTHKILIAIILVPLILISSVSHASHTTYQKVEILMAGDSYNFVKFENYTVSCDDFDSDWLYLLKRDSQFFALIYSAFKNNKSVKLEYYCNKTVPIVRGVRIK